MLRLKDTEVEGKPTRRRRWAWGAVAVVVVAAGVGIGLQATSPPTVCGGQCTSPYELGVLFRPGTSLATERAVVTRCAEKVHIVISYRVGWYTDMARQTKVMTSEFPKSQAGRALNVCFSIAPTVQSAGWPD